jgi:hypothetical protein
MRVIVVLTVAVALVDCVFLAPPPANTTAEADDAQSDESIDAQIAALSGQLGGLKDQVADAAQKMNVTVEDDFQHHCPKEAKAELDNMKDEDIEPAQPKKKESKAKPTGAAGAVLTVFESQMDASNQKSRMDNQAFLLGLLMHKDWSYEQQMDAICDLAHGDALVIKLYKHHSKKESLATQLARMMDAESAKAEPTKAPPLSLEGDTVGSILAKVAKLK